MARERAVTRLKTISPRLQPINSRLPTMGAAGWRTDKQTSGQRGYDYAWQKRREAQLRAEPLCAYCARKGVVSAATVADHITPHHGDPELFAGPLQSLCATCHSSDKQREEREGGVQSLGSIER